MPKRKPKWYWSSHWAQLASIVTVLGFVLTVVLLTRGDSGDGSMDVAEPLDSTVGDSATTFAAFVWDQEDEDWVSSATTPYQVPRPISVLLEFRNTDSDWLNDVTVWIELDDDTAFFEGSTRIKNSSNRDGLWTVNQVDGAVNIGNYGPGANAFVSFVIQPRHAHEDLLCGTNTTLLRAFVTTNEWNREPFEADLVIPIRSDLANCGQ